MDEIMLEFDSPGNVSKLFMIVLLCDSARTRGTDAGHKQRKCAARGFLRFVTCAPNWLAAESVFGRIAVPRSALSVQAQCQCPQPLLSINIKAVLSTRRRSVVTSVALH
jgi:hypothetical protein